MKLDLTNHESAFKTSWANFIVQNPDEASFSVSAFLGDGKSKVNLTIYGLQTTMTHGMTKGDALRMISALQKATAHLTDIECRRVWLIENKKTSE